jgi:hypothetical protein
MKINVSKLIVAGGVLLASTGLVGTAMAAVPRTSENITVNGVTYEAGQSGSRVIVKRNGQQIFRTNGAGDDGTFKDLFVLGDEPYVVVEHWKNGLTILKDKDSSVIAALNVGTVYTTKKMSLTSGAFTATQEGERVYVRQNGKQIFRTNGAGDNGELRGLFVHNGMAHIIVKHYKKGLMILTDRDSGVISATQVGTVEL